MKWFLLAALASVMLLACASGSTKKSLAAGNASQVKAALAARVRALRHVTDRHAEVLGELERYVAAIPETPTDPDPGPEPEPEPEPEPPEPEPNPHPDPDPETGPIARLHPVDDMGAPRGQLAFAPDGQYVQLGVNPGDVRSYAQDIQDAGFSGVRSRLLWTAVERQRGVYDWTAAPNYDRIANTFNDRGMGVLFMLQITTNGMYPDPKSTREGQKAFARFAAAAAKHYAGRNVMFELGNEPNIPNFWSIPRNGSIADTLKAADEYSALAHAVVPSMRAVDPNAFVIGPGLANRGGPYERGRVGAREYVKRLVDNGVVALFDRVSLHLYTAEGQDPKDTMGEGRAPEDSHVDTYRGILGAQVGIMNTEQGWKSNGSVQQNRLQAAYNVRDAIYLLSRGVRLRVWFLWSHSGGQKAYFLHDSLSKRASAMFAAQLDGFDIVRRVLTANPDQYVYEFANESGDRRVVAWKRDAGTEGHYLYQHEGAATVFGMLGETTAVQSTAAGIPLQLSVEPIYLLLR